MQYYHADYSSSLGTLRLISNASFLLELVLPGQSGKYPDTQPAPQLPVLQAATRWLDEYFSGKQPEASSLPIAPVGTDFQKAIWDLLCRIPYGKTVTSGQLAKEIGSVRNISKMSAQAVGQAVGKNPIPIIVPCHRILGSNGALTGYSGGVSCKIQLLDHEKKW